MKPKEHIPFFPLFQILIYLQIRIQRKPLPNSPMVEVEQLEV